MALVRYILDLFCKAGGSAVGLARAFPGARILGIDIDSQPHYPFDFYQADVRDLDPDIIEQFDFVWASPPCQPYMKWGKTNTNYPKLIPFVRRLLQRSNIPYIIENIATAPMIHPIRLCGTMFGLKVFRHRLFETNFPVRQPAHHSHTGFGQTGNYNGAYQTVVAHGAGSSVNTLLWQRAMGINWMNKQELTQAIPPAYAEYIAKEYTRRFPQNWYLRVPKGNVREFF